MSRRLALDYDEIPAIFEWLWVEYLLLSRVASGGGGFSKRHITLKDIEVWERRRGFHFSEYETDLLIELDWQEPKNALGDNDDG